MPKVTRTVPYQDQLIIWRQLTPEVYTVETYIDGRIVGCDVKTGVAPREDNSLASLASKGYAPTTKRGLQSDNLPSGADVAILAPR
jgi:hypothetical protein